jgi:hypothetical protein
MKIGSTANASGTGVTFFNTYPSGHANQYRSIEITTGGSVSFSAPTSGANKALLFHQDPSVPWQANNGSTLVSGQTGAYEGILYFPTTDLTYSGSSSTSYGSSGYTLLIAYNLKIAGTAQVNMDFTSLGGRSPLQMASFAE